MNDYTDNRKETFIGSLMLGFVGISALAGLIPLGYVLVWFLKHYLHMG